MVLPGGNDEYAFIADLYDYVGPYRDRGDIRFFELIYYVTHPDGREERLVHAFTMRYLFRFEAEHLLARAGFQVEGSLRGLRQERVRLEVPGRAAVRGKKGPKIAAMADILQDFPIQAPPARVFEAVSEPALLDQWWTQRSSGRPTVGATYELDFGPGYQWRAVVATSEPGAAFELRLTVADPDWLGTSVGFELTPAGSGTQVRFYHRGWPAVNDHYRTSCHCWALYLRILRRHLEHGESVPYEQRLDV